MCNDVLIFIGILYMNHFPFKNLHRVEFSFGKLGIVEVERGYEYDKFHWTLETCMSLISPIRK